MQMNNEWSSVRYRNNRTISKDGHRIVEIGCIELDNLVPLQKISLLFKSRKESFEKALEVHGYTDEFLSTKNLLK